MALRVSDNPEVDQHYAAQAALSVALVRTLRKLWPTLAPGDLPGSFGTYRRGAAAVAEQFSLSSISLATDHYEAMREQAGVRRPFSTPIIDTLNGQQVEAYLNTAVGPLDLSSLVDEVYLADVITNIQANTEAAMQKVVADAGRDEIIAAAGADRAAKGWARVTRPGACSFCRMLALRGPVYRSKQTADFRSHVSINGRGGECRCTAEPLFVKYEATAQARADAQVWDAVSQEGFKGADARNEFRRRVEGRTNGARRPHAGTPDRKAQAVTQAPGFDNLTPAQLDHQLGILAKLPDSDYRTKQMARVKARLAVLAG